MGFYFKLDFWHYERAYSTLKALEKKRILLKKTLGKALVYSIKKFDDSAYLSFTYYSLNKKNAFIEKYPSVWKAIDEFISKTKLEMVVLFGSYSKDEEKESSDIRGFEYHTQHFFNKNLSHLIKQNLFKI